MATWKKVIVSGSAAELSQLNVNTSQQITALQSTTYLSGSFTGSFTGNGSGLTGVTATAVFPTSQTTPLLSTTKIFSNDGAGNTFVYAGQVTASAYAGVSGDITISAAGVATIAANSVALGTDTTGDYVSTITAGTGIFTTGATSGETIAHTLSVNSGSMLPYYSGSIFSTVSGDITINSAGVSAIGSGVIVNADVNAAAAIDYTKLSLVGSTIHSGSITQYLVGSTVLSGSITSNLSGTGVLSGSNSITIAGVSTALGGAITQATILNGSGVWSGSAQLPSGIISSSATGTNQGDIALNGLDTTINGLRSSSTPTFLGLNITNDVSIGGNLTVTGFVTGSATYITSTNVAIKDQFVLLNSGSGAVVDAGIIVQNAAAAGEAFYWENNVTGTNRWAIASGISPTAVTVTAAEYNVSVATAAGAPSGAPTYGGATNGFGQMYVNSSNSDIYIYA